MVTWVPVFKRAMKVLRCCHQSSPAYLDGYVWGQGDLCPTSNHFIFLKASEGQEEGDGGIRGESCSGPVSKHIYFQFQVASCSDSSKLFLILAHRKLCVLTVGTIYFSSGDPLTQQPSHIAFWLGLQGMITSLPPPAWRRVGNRQCTIWKASSILATQPLNIH